MSTEVSSETYQTIENQGRRKDHRSRLRFVTGQALHACYRICIMDEVDMPLRLEASTRAARRIEGCRGYLTDDPPTMCMRSTRLQVQGATTPRLPSLDRMYDAYDKRFAISHSASGVVRSPHRHGVDLRSDIVPYSPSGQCSLRRYGTRWEGSFPSSISLHTATGLDLSYPIRESKMNDYAMDMW